MSKPKNKEELLQQSALNYSKLTDFIREIPEKDQLFEFPPNYLNRHISDVLMHLYHWHNLFFEWYQQGMNHKKSAMPAPGFTWKTTPALNKIIWQQHQHTSLDQAQEFLQQSHTKIIQLIEKHTNDELFEKKRYPWTGSTSLGAYLISATSSHYHWAFQLIKKAYKTV